MRWSLLDHSEAGAVDETMKPTDRDPAADIIDAALVEFAGRSLISGDEVVDRLLDLRSALAAATLLRELEVSDRGPR